MSVWNEINELKQMLNQRKPEKRPTIDYTPATITLTAGSTTGGAVSDVQSMFSGGTYDVDEVAATPGFDIRFNFTGVTRVPRFIVTRCHYNGSATHYVGVDLYNYDTTSWDQFDLFIDTSNWFITKTIIVPLVNAVDYTSSGAAIVRLYHYTAGNASHDILVDYVGLAH